MLERNNAAVSPGQAAGIDLARTEVIVDEAVAGRRTPRPLTDAERGAAIRELNPEKLVPGRGAALLNAKDVAEALHQTESYTSDLFALARTAAAVTAGQRGVASYSNLGYCMLGELIREKTEKPYPDAVRDLLGIDKRDFALPTEDKPNGYGARGAGFDDTDVASLGPAGGWAASPAAYARLLARRDMKDLRSAPLTTTADGVRWTLGLSVWDRPEGRYLTHLGDLEGVFSLALVSPRRTAAG